MSGLLLAMVALGTVAAVVALAAPFRPPPRRVHRGPHHGYPAVVPAGRSPPPPARPARRPSRPSPARPATAGAVALATGLAFGPPGAVVTLLLASTVPRWRQHRQGRVRLAALEAELPEVVDLLALAVGAGMTVAHAVTAVAQRGLGPLSAELRVVAGEVAHGRRLADALDELPLRAGEPARPLAATLAACERYGTPVVDALERLAAEARDRQRRRAEQAARRLPILLLFPLVLCILPAFALVAIVPLIADAVPALRL